ARARHDEESQDRPLHPPRRDVDGGVGEETTPVLLFERGVDGIRPRVDEETEAQPHQEATRGEEKGSSRRRQAAAEPLETREADDEVGEELHDEIDEEAQATSPSPTPRPGRPTREAGGRGSRAAGPS